MQQKSTPRSSFSSTASQKPLNGDLEFSVLSRTLALFATHSFSCTGRCICHGAMEDCTLNGDCRNFRNSILWSKDSTRCWKTLCEKVSGPFYQNRKRLSIPILMKVHSSFCVRQHRHDPDCSQSRLPKRRVRLCSLRLMMAHLEQTVL
jgi:hypothetical protein